MENQEQCLEEVKVPINQEEQEPENIMNFEIQSPKDSESEQRNQSQLDNSNEQIDIKLAKELMNHQILPPVFIIQAKLSWFERLQSFKEQQGSTNETTQAKHQVEVLEENQKIKQLDQQDFQIMSSKILEKYSHLALKDLSRCTREIVHNYFACILKNSDKMCLLEKIFYDQFMKIYPCHNKSQIKLKEYPVSLILCLTQSKIFVRRFLPWYFFNKQKILDNTQSSHYKTKLNHYFDFVDSQLGFCLNIRLTQSCKSFETLQQQLREHMKKQGDQPMNESVDIKSFSQQISDHECQGYLQKPHSFSHRICQKGNKEIRENSLNNLIDLKYIQNWIYMHENLARLFESAVETEFREDDIPINKPDKQKIHPIVKGYYEKYSQLSEQVKQQKEKLNKSNSVQNGAHGKSSQGRITSSKNMEESKESNGSYTRTDDLLQYIQAKTLGEDMIKPQWKALQSKLNQKAIFSIQNDFRNKDQIPSKQIGKSEEECPYQESMDVDFNGNQDIDFKDQLQSSSSNSNQLQSTNEQRVAIKFDPKSNNRLKLSFRRRIQNILEGMFLSSNPNSGNNNSQDKSSKMPSDQVIDSLMTIMDEYAGKLLQQNQQKQNDQ